MADDQTPVRFGFLGCAQIARKLSRAVDLAPNSILYAIASRSIDKAKQFAIQNGLSDTVRVYSGYDELLDDPCVDAVYMPLPTSLHVRWAISAAERKKHLLLEKPTALDTAELDRILEACESNGVQFMDATMWYHHPRTAKMKDLISDSRLFGQIRAIHSSSTFLGTPEFLENDIRVKPDLDSLGALGDTGWYCIAAILWAMDYRPPTTVTALPSVSRNSAGVILSCASSLTWEDEKEVATTVATFHCSFLAHETMDLSINGTNGTIHVKDFIIPFEEKSGRFRFTSGAKFVDLHVGWNVMPEEVETGCELPQESGMVREFADLVKEVTVWGREPDRKWGRVSRMIQLVMDAVKKSIENDCKSVYL